MTKPKKPPRVEDRYLYWQQPPPERSERCAWWVEQLAAGNWRPNRAFRTEGYDARCEILGVWMWEYFHVLLPLLHPLEDPIEHAAAEIAGDCWCGRA